MKGLTTMTKTEYITEINQLLKSANYGLLDFVLKLLRISITSEGESEQSA